MQTILARVEVQEGMEGFKPQEPIYFQAFPSQVGRFPW